MRHAATPVADSVAQVVAWIEDARLSTPVGRATLVAIGGIDGARKGYVATRPSRRRATRLDAPRLDEMFARVVDPLVRDRRVSVTFDLAEEASFGYRTETLDLRDVHFALDAPRDVADVVIDDDPRLTPATARPEPRA